MLRNNINIGELDTLVTVQSCTISKGDVGQKQYAFADHSKVWAKIERDIEEGVENLNLESARSLSATIYKIQGLSSRWRIIVHGVPYNIVSIDPISRYSPLCVVGLTAIDG